MNKLILAGLLVVAYVAIVSAQAGQSGLQSLGSKKEQAQAKKAQRIANRESRQQRKATRLANRQAKRDKLQQANTAGVEVVDTHQDFLNFHDKDALKQTDQTKLAFSDAHSFDKAKASGLQFGAKDNSGARFFLDDKLFLEGQSQDSLDIGDEALSQGASDLQVEDNNGLNILGISQFEGALFDSVLGRKRK